MHKLPPTTDKYPWELRKTQKRPPALFPGAQTYSRMSLISLTVPNAALHMARMPCHSCFQDTFCSQDFKSKTLSGSQDTSFFSQGFWLDSRRPQELSMRASQDWAIRRAPFPWVPHGTSLESLIVPVVGNFKPLPVVGSTASHSSNDYLVVWVPVWNPDMLAS